ncbi:MAG: hypothetical protein ABIG11_08590, partial [bacterium]
ADRSGGQADGGSAATDVRTDRTFSFTGGKASRLARLARRLNVIANEARISDSPAVVAEMGLFSLIEAPADIEGWVRRLESVEGKMRVVPDSSGPHKTDYNACDEKKSSSGCSHALQPAPSDDQRSSSGCGQRPSSAQGADGEVPPPADRRTRSSAQGAGGEVPPPAGRRTRSAAQGAAPHPETEAGAASDMPDGTAWRKLLDSMSIKKPFIYNMLVSCSVSFTGRNEWKLVFAKSFEMEAVKRAKKEIEAVLAGISGRKIELAMEAGAAAPAHQHIEELSNAGKEQAEKDEGAAGGTDDAAGGKWEEISSDDSVEEDSGLKKLLKVFPGRVRKIKKT